MEMIKDEDPVLKNTNKVMFALHIYNKLLQSNVRRAQMISILAHSEFVYIRLKVMHGFISSYFSKSIYFFALHIYNNLLFYAFHSLSICPNSYSLYPSMYAMFKK